MTPEAYLAKVSADTAKNKKRLPMLKLDVQARVPGCACSKCGGGGRLAVPVSEFVNRLGEKPFADSDVLMSMECPVCVGWGVADPELFDLALKEEWKGLWLYVNSRRGRS